MNPDQTLLPAHWEILARQAEFKPAKMASLCGVSERHLQRIFKKQVGCAPRRWLRDLQCGLAKELIGQGYSSKAAAAELGFATEPHFCREFKKVFGVSPQKFAPNRFTDQAPPRELLRARPSLVPA